LPGTEDAGDLGEGFVLVGARVPSTRSTHSQRPTSPPKT
jgi:hypothetical protein